MDFKDYKARLLSFGRIFLMLSMIPNLKDKLSSDDKKGFVSDLRNRMEDPRRLDYIPGVPVTLQVKMLTTIKSVNLAADIETLTQQAEAVKNEIIEHEKILKEALYKIKIEGVPHVAVITDFIRDPTGKIVYPFDYWRDCVEVYLRKNFYGHSNGKIAKNSKFKTTDATIGRQREKVVADMLAETERLIKAVSTDCFPPSILRGKRQPTMINEGVIN